MIKKTRRKEAVMRRLLLDIQEWMSRYYGLGDQVADGFIRAFEKRLKRLLCD